MKKYFPFILAHYLLSGALLTGPTAATASDIVEVLPLTNRVLLVHFDDGTVRHHQRGEQRTNEWVLAPAPLNLALATAPGTYSLASPDDGAYAPAKAPTQVGRKTKGTQFAWLCQAYNNGCLNTSPDRAHEHWLYLTLPTPLQPGRRYTLSTGALATNGATWSFTYDDTRLRSEAVHVNNVGYAPEAPAKYAYVYHWMGTQGGLSLAGYAGRPFRLLDAATRQAVFSGTLAFRKSATNEEFAYAGQSPNGNLLGAEVYECDFSGFRTPGEYVVSVEGVGCSFPFRIAADAYWEPFYWTMKGIYQQRSGLALTAPYTDAPRPVPHHPTLTPGFAGKLKYTTTRHYDLTSSDGVAADKPTLEAGLKGNLTTWGWYQDAGDWDAYFQHAKVPSYLLFLYETNPARFTDNQLNIPESGNGLPDLLDEAAWLIRFYKRTKDAIRTAGYGTGGVGGARVFGDLWGEDTRPDGTTKASWEDTDRQWVITGEDPFMTYKYAGLAAHLAYLLHTQGLTDPEGVNWQQEALDAYAWASAHVRLGDEVPKFDYNLRQIRLYAAASLYRLTGTASFHQQLQTDVAAAQWNSTTVLEGDWQFPAWVYLRLPAGRATHAPTLAATLAAFVRTGDFLMLDFVDRRACRWAGNFWQPMNTGQSTTPHAAAGVMGAATLPTTDATRAANYLKYTYTTADYFLGTNPLNTTWITGVGERHPNEIFHLDSWYSGTGKTRKGVVPYGPWQRDVALGPPGPWNNTWPYSTLVPAIEQWPGHEQWYDQRSSPLSAEFTVWQTNALAAFTYGFLWAQGTGGTRLAASPAAPAAPASALRAYPTVFGASLTAEFAAPKAGTVQLRLLDALGQPRWRGRYAATAGPNTWTLRLPAAASGVYILEAEQHGRISRQRVVRE
ncbi:glycoside hydrolase family 9 protein [Hymenobacter weizhouensis]|uniref:glycoside hydrolase family 9 protein n=1 Tax=Hymenobacter sp. YIM 151500-1 TaxID=2987689 RepID=UPI0022267DD4|nr:glycoside hydrolase family 9 protein [Hymenobacter sp. YIM 151500-1]UYZ64785.1 glycoside hydrolase family 9 protein [Hymenobacter sp. YIM 151500-1]